MCGAQMQSPYDLAHKNAGTRLFSMAGGCDAVVATEFKGTPRQVCAHVQIHDFFFLTSLTKIIDRNV